MMRLIYEKSARIKVEIIRTILKNNGEISKNQLLTIFDLSYTTLEKYLLELHIDLPTNAIEIGKNAILINVKICSLYDAQIYYLSKSIVSDILEYCFSQNLISFERLAQNLFISPSKLFNVIKFLNAQLSPLDIYIQNSPYVVIEGKEDDILVLYHLLLQLLDRPFDYSYSKLSRHVVNSKVIKFFQHLGIRNEGRVIDLFSLWILTISDRAYFKKIIKKKSSIFSDEDFLDEESSLYSCINRMLSGINDRIIDREGKLLLSLFLIFNDSLELNFESPSDEENFYTHELKINYTFHPFILSILTKKNYNIAPRNIEIISLKIEGSLKYYDILFPYYYFYREFFNPNLKNSKRFKILVEMYKKDFSSFLETESFITDNNIYEFLAHITSDFQKEYFASTIFTIGIYSSKGPLFEEQLCNEIKESIEVYPYYQLNNRNGQVDLLLVDDLRLLNNPLTYKKYLLLGDYYSEDISK